MNLSLSNRSTSCDSQIPMRERTLFAKISSAGRGFSRVLLSLAALVAGLSLAAAAQQPEFIDREPEIKAAYLYNFARYVEWPASAGPQEFVIGVVGDTPVAVPLRTIADTKKVNNRVIAIRHFKDEKEFRQCHVLFVPAGQDPKLVAALLKKAKDTATLIVGEGPDFALKHGHIGFYPEQNSVKFEINSGSADKAKLKISSKLLSLGRIVGEKPGK